MNSCELVCFITGLACSIAKGKTQGELDILAIIFTQLRDTLATISTFNLK